MLEGDRFFSSSVSSVVPSLEPKPRSGLLLLPLAELICPPWKLKSTHGSGGAPSIAVPLLFESIAVPKRNGYAPRDSLKPTSVADLARSAGIEPTTWLRRPVLYPLSYERVGE